MTQMMHSKQVLSMLSLAMKAGKIKSGEFQCEEAVKSREAYLVIIAEDAGKNTVSKFINSSVYYDIPYVICETVNSLGHSIGKGPRSVIAVTDDGFAKSIKGKLNI